MKVEKTPLDGLLLIHPVVHGDRRGFLYESYNERDFRQAGIKISWVQDNHVRSVKNTLRGLHFQSGRGQDKLVRCTQGRVWDVAVDIRPASATLGRWFGAELTSENKLMFLIPRGFAHGYCVLSDEAEVQYKCSTLYDADLEAGFRWNDPKVAVQWPAPDPILSQRDLESQSFEDCMARLRAGS